MSDILDLLTPILEHNPYETGDMPGLLDHIMALSDAMEEAGRMHGAAWLRTVRLLGHRERNVQRGFDVGSVLSAIYLWEPFPPATPDSKPAIGQGWESELLWNLRMRFRNNCPLCDGGSKGSPFYCPKCRQTGWVLAPDEQPKGQRFGHYKAHDLAPVEREIEREMRYGDDDDLD